MKLVVFALIAGITATITAGSASAADAPKNPCYKPEIPSRMASDSDLSMKRFNKNNAAYKKCITAFVDEQRAIAEHSTDSAAAAQAHDAAEAAIVEFNDHIAKLNERNDQASDDNGDAKQQMGSAGSNN